MATQTKIEWADKTFNPWIGCAKVDAGCAHCYAEADFDKRRGRVRWGTGEQGGTRSVTAPSTWSQPIRWNRQAEAEGVRYRVFCASLADVFEDWQGPIVDSKGRELRYCGDLGITEAPTMDRYTEPLTMEMLRRELFDLIDATPNLDWLILTKRPENIQRMWPIRWEIDAHNPHAQHSPACQPDYRSNVWLYTSVSDQASADVRIPQLLACRDLVPILGISAEPLLGPIQFGVSDEFFDYGFGNRSKLDHIIVGGESGPSARTCDVDWIRSIRDQCAAAGVPVFVKQLGAACYSTLECELSECYGDPKSGNPKHWPEDLRVRQMPQVDL